MADNKRLSLGGRIATPRVPPAMSMEQVLARSIGASIRIQTIAPASRTLTGHVFAVSPSSPVITISSYAVLGLAASGTGSASLPAATPSASFTVLPISSIQSFTLLDLGSHGAASSANTPVTSGASTPTSPRAATPNSGTGNAVKSGVAAGGSGAVTPRQALPQLPPLPLLDNASAQRRLAETVARLHAEEARRGKGVGPEAQALFDALYRTLPVEWHGKDIVVSSSVVVSAPYGPADCRLTGKGGNAQALARVKKVVEMERKKIATAGNGTKESAQEIKKGG